MYNVYTIEMVGSVMQTILEYDHYWVSVSPLFCSLQPGRQFLQAEEVLFSAVHASYEESLEAGIQCFLLAMDVSAIYYT